MTTTHDLSRARFDRAAGEPDGVVATLPGEVTHACAHCEHGGVDELPEHEHEIVDAIRAVRWRLVDHAREEHGIARPTVRYLDYDAGRVTILRKNWGREL